MFKVLQAVARHSREPISLTRLSTTNCVQINNNQPQHLTFNRLIVRYSSSRTKMPKALIVVADGTEEMEAVITADVLRRGKVETTIAGLNSADPVKCSCGVKLLPDMSLDNAMKADYDAVILPGGLDGATAFRQSSALGTLLKKQDESGKICAAICAAPTAFKEHGIGIGKALTSYPTLAETFKKCTDYKYQDDEAVVVDGHLVTSRGPGTTFAFGLKLVELLVDKKTSDEIKAGMLVK